MKKVLNYLLFALVFTSAALCQSITPNIGLNDVPGDQSYSNNMLALDSILVGSRASVVVAPQSIATTTLSTTSLVFPPVPPGKTYHGTCTIIWEQLTGVSTVQFGLGQSVVPTNLWALSALSFGSGGGSTQVTYLTQNATTPTVISGAAAAPGLVATGYRETINITVINAAVSPDVVTIYGNTGNVADALVIEPGSHCGWSM